MKRTVAILIAAVMMISLVPAAVLAALTLDNHQHVFGDYTSNNNGTHSRTCSECSETVTDDCTDNGNGVCKYCAYKLYTVGDYNGDGMINSDDAILMLSKINGENVDTDQPLRDFNGDGEINGDDAIFLLFGAFFPTEYKLVPDKEKRWDDDGVLRILTIGNSFSDDTMQYIYQIAKSAGVNNVELGNLYIGGCTLDTHASNARDDKSAYEYRVNTNGSWSTTASYKMSAALESKDWDFISMQQASGSSGIAATYSILEYLINYVRAHSNSSAKLVWNMTWAYQHDSTHTDFPKYDKDQMKMYNAILAAVASEVDTKEEIVIVSPTGTAIQNARTSFVGDNLTRDGYHLTFDLGRYTAGLTFFSALTGISVENLAYAPDGLDDSYKAVAIESAVNAIATPRAVTQSEYTELPPIDTDQYVRLEMEWTPLAYWQSQDVNYHHTLIGWGDNSNQFYASKMFTKDELPVGSIITLAEGWKYRPEGWKSEGQQSTRPDPTAVERVTVTESWWGSYTQRAFNLFKTGQPALTLSENVDEAFAIWIPKELAVEPAAKETWIKIDLDWTENGYWQSQDGSRHHRIITGDTTAKKFYATKMFTKDELPVGSIIIVESGWQYRPEAWKDENKQASRPGNTTVTKTVITEEWWGEYVNRAFNLSKTDGSELSAGIDMDDVFTVIVPTSALPENHQVTGDLYVRADLEYTPLGYWNSADGTNHHKITTGASNSKNFYASRMFTKGTLPVGSMILLEPEWQYRPEGWRSAGVQSGRKNNTTEIIKDVTESWWEDYRTRAFNLSRATGSADLNGYEESAILDALMILVPLK